MRINLGCREIRMSKQLFQTFNSYVMIQHCRSKRMSQHMRTFFLQRANPCEVRSHDIPDLCRLHPFTFIRKKECRRRSFNACIPQLKIFAERIFKLVTEWYYSLFVSLTRYLDLRIHEADITVIQIHEFRQSHPGFIERYNYGTRTYIIIIIAPHLPIQKFSLSLTNCGRGFSFLGPLMLYTGSDST